MEWITDLFVPFGYVGVGQDMRGTEKSEGNFTMWHSDVSKELCLLCCCHIHDLTIILIIIKTIIFLLEPLNHQYLPIHNRPKILKIWETGSSLSPGPMV